MTKKPTTNSQKGAPAGAKRRSRALGLDLESAQRDADAAVGERDRLIAAVSENFPGVFGRVGRDLRYRFASQGYERIFGAPPRAMLGRTIQEVIGDHAYQRAEPYAMRALAGERVTFENLVVAPSGAEMHGLATFVPDVAADGTVCGFFIIAVDNTDRRQSEAALRESEEYLRSIIALEPECVKVISPDGRLLEMNPAGLAMLDVDSLDEIRGRPLLDFVAPEHREAFVELHRRVMTGGSGRLEFLAIGRKGTRRWLETHAVPYRKGRGEIIGLLGITRDVTERKKAEQAAVESERRLSTLIANLPGYVYRVANDRRYSPEYISEGVFAITGYDQREYLVERTTCCGDEIEPEDRDAVWQIVQRAVAARQPYECEYRIRTKTGSVKWVWERGSAIIGPSGDVIALEGFVTDVTERTAMQARLQQAHKMDSVGRLAGGVAHDFNNLLTVINSTAEIALLDLKDGDPQREALAQIRTAADRAAALTRQLLAFGRRQILKPIVLDVNAVITDMQGMLERLVGEDIKLISRPVPQLKSVMADTSQIEQVIMNLVVNARDAMPHGGTLTIETANVELDDSFVANHPSVVPGPHTSIAVSDTGVGMDASTVKHIFEPFFSTKGGLGTGLGLSTVYGIVKQSNGSVWVASAPGQGATFTIYLPQVDDPAPRVVQAAEREAATGNETILLVEDEEAVRTVAKRLLVSAGFSMLTAASGVEALQLIQHHAGPIHLLLTDVIMPDMGGRELADRILKVRPDIRVLFASGYADDAISRRGVLDEATHFIGKPFSAADLTRKVRQVLDS